MAGPLAADLVLPAVDVRTGRSRLNVINGFPYTGSITKLRAARKPTAR